MIMIEIYADLVDAGERSLDGTNGIKKVPSIFIEDVKKELERRKLISDDK